MPKTIPKRAKKKKAHLKNPKRVQKPNKPRLTIETLPSEMIAEIISHTPISDRLAVGLTSRTLAAHLPLARPDEEEGEAHSRFSQVVIAHSRIEAAYPRGRKLNILVCAACGKLKTSENFTAAQWRRKAKLGRMCIPCWIHISCYTFIKAFRMTSGERGFACIGCEKAIRLTEEYKGPVDVPTCLRLTEIKYFCGVHYSQRWCQTCGELAMEYEKRHTSKGTFRLYPAVHDPVGLVHEGHDIYFHWGRVCHAENPHPWARNRHR